MYYSNPAAMEVKFGGPYEDAMDKDAYPKTR